MTLEIQAGFETDIKMQRGQNGKREPNPPLSNNILYHNYDGCELVFYLKYIYIQARTILIGNINRVTTCYTLDIEFLTCGSDNLTCEQNCIIFKYVFDYIKCSKRFLIV